MPAPNKDLFELKLRKKLLAQQLNVVDDKVDRLMRITAKRQTLKNSNSNNENNNKNNPASSRNSKTNSRSNSSSRQQPFALTKQLMAPKVIEPFSTFDQVRKRNVLRHTKAVLERKPKKVSRRDGCRSERAFEKY